MGANRRSRDTRRASGADGRKRGRTEVRERVAGNELGHGSKRSDGVTAPASSLPSSFTPLQSLQPCHALLSSFPRPSSSMTTAAHSPPPPAPASPPPLRFCSSFIAPAFPPSPPRILPLFLSERLRLSAFRIFLFPPLESSLWILFFLSTWIIR